MKIYLSIISCLVGFIPLFGIDLGSKSGVVYLSAGEVYFCALDHQDTLQLTSTGHRVTEFALSSDKRFLAYSKMFKIVDEPGNWDSIVPQVPVCSIVMLDLKEQKVVNEIFPQEYEWLHIYYWVNARQLLCDLSSGFSVDDFYLYDTAGRVDTLGEGGWDTRRVIKPQPLSADSSAMSVIRENKGAIHLIDGLHKTDTVIFKESDNIHFEAMAPDFQSFVWSEAHGGYYISNSSSYSYDYHLYIKNIASGDSKVVLEGKDERNRRSDEFRFSPDNSVMSINWFRGDHVDLYFLKNNQLLTIEGQLVDWIDARRLMLVKDDNLYIYDTGEKKYTLFMTDVRKPQFVY